MNFHRVTLVIQSTDCRVKGEAAVTIQVGNDGVMGQDSSSDRVSDSGHILKEKIIRFTDESGCRCEGKRGVKKTPSF